MEAMGDVCGRVCGCTCMYVCMVKYWYGEKRKERKAEAES